MLALKTIKKNESLSPYCGARVLVQTFGIDYFYEKEEENIAWARLIALVRRFMDYLCTTTLYNVHTILYIYRTLQRNHDDCNTITTMLLRASPRCPRPSPRL